MGYQPLKPPVTLHRRFERCVSTPVTKGPRGQDLRVAQWMEPLLGQLSGGRRPAGDVFHLRCTQRHPLLWLVSTQWGL